VSCIPVRKYLLQLSWRFILLACYSCPSSTHQKRIATLPAQPYLQADWEFKQVRRLRILLAKLPGWNLVCSTKIEPRPSPQFPISIGASRSTPYLCSRHHLATQGNIVVQNSARVVSLDTLGGHDIALNNEDAVQSSSRPRRLEASLFGLGTQQAATIQHRLPSSEYSSVGSNDLSNYDVVPEERQPGQDAFWKGTSICDSAVLWFCSSASLKPSWWRTFPEVKRLLARLACSLFRRSRPTPQLLFLASTSNLSRHSIFFTLEQLTHDRGRVLPIFFLSVDIRFYSSFLSQLPFSPLELLGPSRINSAVRQHQGHETRLCLTSRDGGPLHTGCALHFCRARKTNGLSESATRAGTIIPLSAYRGKELGLSGFCSPRNNTPLSQSNEEH
jgi:hypothetical protein